MEGVEVAPSGPEAGGGACHGGWQRPVAAEKEREERQHGIGGGGQGPTVTAEPVPS